MKKISILLGLMCLYGCGSCCRGLSNYNIDFSSYSKTINAEQSLYIALPEDAAHKKTTGKAIQQELYTKLSLRTEKLDNAFTTLSEEEYLKEAKNMGVDLLVLPKITYWEDRTTTWSGRPDKGEIVVDIIDVKTAKSINRAKISAEGPTMTFVNYHPDHWLGKGLKEYVDRLYSTKE